MSAAPNRSATTALAAEVTERPPQWRGDVGIAYEAVVVPDSLQEDGQIVGERRAVDHLITYSDDRMDGLPATELALPQQASSRIAFSNMNRMAYDPVLETGTMVGTGDGRDQTVKGSVPAVCGFDSRAPPCPSPPCRSRRPDHLAHEPRLPVPRPDIILEYRRQRVYPASPAFEFASYWSTQNNRSEPYLGVTWTHRFETESDTHPGPVQDPSTLDLTVGMEILLFDDASFAEGLGTELALDLHATFGHQSWGDGVSGVQLANALPITRGRPVSQGETNSLWTGFDLRWRIARYVDWTVSHALGAPFGRTLEHPYAVVSATDGKLGWKLGTALTFRMRDPLFDQR